jgi:hypothetical protein
LDTALSEEDLEGVRGGGAGKSFKESCAVLWAEGAAEGEALRDDMRALLKIVLEEQGEGELLCGMNGESGSLSLVVI